MALDIQGITNPFEIQSLVDEIQDVEDLKRLQLLVTQGEIGNAEQRTTLHYYIGGKIKKLSGK